MEKLVDIVRDNVAKLTHVVAGVLYYRIETAKMVYIFTVDMNDKEDVGNARFDIEHKAMHLVRYFNKAVANNSLISYEKKFENNI